MQRSITALIAICLLAPAAGVAQQEEDPQDPMPRQGMMGRQGGMMGGQDELLQQIEYFSPESRYHSAYTCAFSAEIIYGPLSILTFAEYLLW